MSSRLPQTRTIDSLTADEISSLESLLPKLIASRTPDAAGYAAVLMYRVVYPRRVAQKMRFTGRQRRAAFGNRGTGQ
jgi:hypothetical protein